MNIDRTRIREGMTVFSSDGEKLGKVLSCDPSMFVIEKGFFFPKDYIARYDDVTSIDGDDIHLALSKETFQDLRDTSKTTSEGWRAGSFTTQGKPDTTTADVIGADYGLGSAGLGQPGMSDDLSKSARREATAEPSEAELEVRRRPVVKQEVPLARERYTERRAADEDVGTAPRRSDDFGTTRPRGDEDLGTTPRRSDEDTTGTRGGISDPFPGKIPPRDDT